MARSSRPLWLVVTGASRSGTTCLAQVLNTHPNIVCTHEAGPFRLAHAVHSLVLAEAQFTSVTTGDATAGSEPTAAADAVGGTDVETVSALVAEAETYGALSEFEARHAFYDARHQRVLKALADPVLMPRAADFDTLARTLAGTIGRKTDVKVIGDKLPNAHLLPPDPVVERYGLHVKTLFIIRNPMDAINSSMGRRNNTRIGVDTWQVATVEEATAEWLNAWNYAVSRADDPDFLAIKYEDLIARFEEKATEIAGFLDLDAQFENVVELLSVEHRLYALTPSERDYVQDLFGDFLTRWPMTDLRPLLDSNLRLFSAVPAGEARFNEGALGSLILQEGFYPPEPQGWWTSGRRAVVRFRAPPSDRLWVDFTVHPYLLGRSGFEFALRAAGGAYAHHRVVAGEALPTRRGLLVSAPDGQVEIEVFIPEPKKPDEEPESDPRSLGLNLSELRAFEL